MTVHPAESAKFGSDLQPMHKESGSYTRDLGSGLIDQSQKMTTAAMHIAEKNV